jgi:hypothetical protein
MKQTLCLRLRRGVAFFIAAACIAPAIAEDREACSSGDTETAAPVLLQKAAKTGKLAYVDADQDHAAAQSMALLQEKPVVSKVKDEDEAADSSVAFPPAVALKQAAAAPQSEAAREAGKATLAHAKAPGSSAASSPAVALKQAAAAPQSEAAREAGKTIPAPAKAAPVAGKAAPALAEASSASAAAKVAGKAAPSHTGASPKGSAAVKAAPALPEVEESQRHRIIPAAMMGPAGGMSHEDLLSDEMAVGALDFVATGAHTEYCRDWLKNSWMCEFGTIFLGLMICTPILALSVAAFWGIVTGLKSVNQ